MFWVGYFGWRTNFELQTQHYSKFNTLKSLSIPLRSLFFSYIELLLFYIHHIKIIRNVANVRLNLHNVNLRIIITKYNL